MGKSRKSVNHNVTSHLDESTARSREHLPRFQRKHPRIQIISPRQAPGGHRSHDGETTSHLARVRENRFGRTKHIKEREHTFSHISRDIDQNQQGSPTVTLTPQVVTATPKEPEPPAGYRPVTPPYGATVISRWVPRRQRLGIDPEVIDLSIDDEIRVTILSDPILTPTNVRQPVDFNSLPLTTEPLVPDDTTSQNPVMFDLPCTPARRTLSSTQHTNNKTIVKICPGPLCDPIAPSEILLSTKHEREPTPELNEPGLARSRSPPVFHPQQVELEHEGTWPAELLNILQSIRRNIEAGVQCRRTRVARIINGQHYRMMVNSTGAALLKCRARKP